MLYLDSNKGLIYADTHKSGNATKNLITIIIEKLMDCYDHEIWPVLLPGWSSY